MRMTIIAVLGALLLIPVTTTAYSSGLTQSQMTAELAAATKKKKPAKKQKEKVEYMRSAAPPEPKK